MTSAVVKLGRPFIRLDEVLIFELASVMCTMEDIARICRCSVDTLERNYAETIKDGRASARCSLRRKQFQMAMDGNPTMNIWLGKQVLGQRDKTDLRVGNPDGSALGTPPSNEAVTLEQAEQTYLAMIAVVPADPDEN